MTLEALTCSKCGALLEVPKDTHFLTCTHCSSRLEVKRAPGAAYTELLDGTAAIPDEPADSRARGELDRLDEEWAVESEQWTVRRSGLPKPPGRYAVAGGIIVAVFGLAWLVILTSMFSGFRSIAGNVGGPIGSMLRFGLGFMLTFGLVLIVVALVGGVKSSRSAREYSQAEQRYQARREDVLRRARQQP
jgi:DNA-directed RNA polymerase subunit RPC12/RpoP